ncbi:MAG: hypothetical protein GX240_02805 [Candidatus Atribacteria bacterium]|nr:hypothetical protein [Candidatus Atribacteria bacterium]
MRRILLTALPYGALVLFAMILVLIFWPPESGLIELTNSWIGLFFISAFCAIFLFQEDIYQFFDQRTKWGFLGASIPLQKNRTIPDLFRNDQKFQEIISDTVIVWMDKILMDKQEQRAKEEEIIETIERFKKEKKDYLKWSFLFADYFLVPHSKDVLYEIYERHYITKDMFQEIIAKMAIDEQEAEAISDILRFFRFIRKQEEELVITEIGSAYCTYLERISQ